MIFNEETMFTSSRSFSILRSTVENEIMALIASVVLEGKKQNHFYDIDETFAAYLVFKLLPALTSPNTFPFDANRVAIDSTHVFIDVFANGIIKK